LPSLNSLLL